MAKFIGTFDDLNKYIGPRLRNVVQQKTKKYKKDIGHCEHCKKDGVTLDAAHKGKDRIQIINEITKPFTDGKLIEIDLGLLEELFIARHIPLEDSFLVLCRSCHKKYDSPKTKNTSCHSSLKIILSSQSPDQFKQKLIKTKKARIIINYKNKKSETKLWNAKKINKNSNIIGNLRSRNEFRKGVWEKAGITYIEVIAIDKD